MSFDAVTVLAPAIQAIAGVDLSHRGAAEDLLQSRVDAATMASISDALRQANERGELTSKQATPTLAFGRLAKPSDATEGMSIDVVDIEGAGAAHAHPQGEVSWCVPLSGEPVFEGASEGWVVLPPHSQHVPTVTGGRMLIVYFLPEGAVDWNV